MKLATFCNSDTTIHLPHTWQQENTESCTNGLANFIGQSVAHMARPTFQWERKDKLMRRRSVPVVSSLGHGGPIWTYLDLFGPIWTHGPDWTYWDLFWAICTLFKPIWTYMDPFGPIWTPLEQFEPKLTSLDHFWPYKTILTKFGINLDHFRPFKII